MALPVSKGSRTSSTTSRTNISSQRSQIYKRIEKEQTRVPSPSPRFEFSTPETPITTKTETITVYPKPIKEKIAENPAIRQAQANVDKTLQKIKDIKDGKYPNLKGTKYYNTLRGLNIRLSIDRKVLAKTTQRITDLKREARGLKVKGYIPINKRSSKDKPRLYLRPDGKYQLIWKPARYITETYRGKKYNILDPSFYNKRKYQRETWINPQKRKDYAKIEKEIIERHRKKHQKETTKKDTEKQKETLTKFMTKTPLDKIYDTNKKVSKIDQPRVLTSEEKRLDPIREASYLWAVKTYGQDTANVIEKGRNKFEKITNKIWGGPRKIIDLYEKGKKYGKKYPEGKYGQVIEGIDEGITGIRNTLLIEYPMWLPTVAAGRFVGETVTSGGRNLYEMGVETSKIGSMKEWRGNLKDNVRRSVEIPGSLIAGAKVGSMIKRRGRSFRDIPERTITVKEFGELRGTDPIYPIGETIRGETMIRLTPEKTARLKHSFTADTLTEQILIESGQRKYRRKTGLDLTSVKDSKTMKKIAREELKRKNVVLGGKTARLQDTKLKNKIKELIDKGIIGKDAAISKDLDTYEIRETIKPREINTKLNEINNPYIKKEILTQIGSDLRKLINKKRTKELDTALRRNENILKRNELILDGMHPLQKASMKSYNEGMLTGGLRDRIVHEKLYKQGKISKELYEDLTKDKPFIKDSGEIRDLDIRHLTEGKAKKLINEMVDSIEEKNHVKFDRVYRKLKNEKGKYDVKTEDLGTFRDIFTGNLFKKGQTVKVETKEFNPQTGKWENSNTAVFPSDRGGSFVLYRAGEKGQVQKMKIDKLKGKKDPNDAWLIDSSTDKTIIGKIDTYLQNKRAYKVKDSKTRIQSELDKLRDQADKAVNNPEKWHKGIDKFEEAIKLGLIKDGKITKIIGKGSSESMSKLAEKLAKKGRKTFTQKENGRTMVLEEIKEGETNKLFESIDRYETPEIVRSRDIETAGGTVEGYIAQKYKGSAASYMRDKITDYEIKLARRALEFETIQKAIKKEKNPIKKNRWKSMFEDAKEQDLMARGDIESNIINDRITDVSHHLKKLNIVQPQLLKLWTRKSIPWKPKALSESPSILLTKKELNLKNIRSNGINTIRNRIGFKNNKLESMFKEELKKAYEQKKPKTKLEHQKVLERSYAKVKGSIERINKEQLKEIEKAYKSGERYKKYAKSKYPYIYRSTYSKYRVPYGKEGYTFTPYRKYNPYTKGYTTYYQPTKYGTTYTATYPKTTYTPRTTEIKPLTKEKTFITLKQAPQQTQVKTLLPKKFKRVWAYRPIAVDHNNNKTMLPFFATYKEARGAGMEYVDNEKETEFHITGDTVNPKEIKKHKKYQKLYKFQKHGNTYREKRYHRYDKPNEKSGFSMTPFIFPKNN